MTITVFTPTFNRANKLPKLYDSLQAQTNKNFEWIIVDDGSTDATKQVVESFLTPQQLNITYVFQKNSGKHTAINKGVALAKGTLFIIVDSDDFLPKNALERISYFYDINKNQPDFGGVAGRRSYFDGTFIGSTTSFEYLFCNAIDFRFKHRIKGDLAEVFLTKVLRQFPFPEIENEKFCPEDLIWNRIAQRYKLFYFNENIYHCEYLPDGLTAKIVKIRMTSPMASMLTYSELASYKIPFLQKVKATINFWRFSFNSKLSIVKKLKMVSSLYSFFCFPLGFLYFLKDQKQLKR